MGRELMRAMAGRPLPAGELARKAVHLSMGLFALALRWLTWPQAAMCAVAAFAFNLLVLPAVLGHRLRSEREDVSDRGVLLYPLVVLVLIVLFHRPGHAAGGMYLAAFGWGLLAGGDATAGLVGMKWGRHELPWNPRKTWEGLAGYTVGGAVIGTALLMWNAPGLMHLVARATPLWLLHAAAILLAAGTAAVLEGVPHGLDDNVLPPLLGAYVLFTLHTLHGGVPALPLSGAFVRTMALAVLVNSVIAGAALAVRLLEPAGVAAAWVLGVATWGFGSWRAYLLLWVFLGVGTAVTGLRRAHKRAAGLEDEARRGVRHVLANGLMCLLGSLLFWVTGGKAAAAAMVAAGLAAALADTMGSEVGKAYGRRAYSLPGLRRVPPGTEGAVSLPGTMAALVGSAAVAVAAVGTGFLSRSWLLPVVAAGFLAMLAEGVLPRLGDHSNEGTNLANTVIGVILAFALWRLL